MTDNTGRDRVWFAQAIRAVACLMVVWAHLGESFFIAPRTIAQLALIRPVAPGTPPWFGTTRALLDPGVDWGYLGVALFLLTSGFVIPFSLRRRSLRGFMVRRVFRIYPVYWLALGGLPGGAFFAYYNWHVYGSPLKTGYGDVSTAFSSSFVPHNLAHFVQWIPALLTFFVCAALVAPFFRAARNRDLAVLGLWALVLTGFYAFYGIVDDNATKIVGKHELQFGFHFRADQMNLLPQQQQGAGSDSWASTGTALYDPNTSRTSPQALPFTGDLDLAPVAFQLDIAGVLRGEFFPILLVQW